MSFCLALWAQLQAADGFWRMAIDLGMTGQPNWNYYNGGDSPEGAYMGWIWEGKTNLTGSIALGRSLEPGTYYVLLKVIDYTGAGQIEVAMGGGSALVATINSDWNKYWTMPAAVTVSVATSNLTLKLLKTSAPASVQKYLLRGVYITRNARENVPMYGYDRIVDYTYPTAMEESAPVKRNLLPNGSFEAGIGHGWGLLVEGYEREYPLDGLWDPTTGAVGRASLRFQQKASRLISPVIQVKPNTRHTLSVWAKTSSTSGIGLSLVNTTEACPPGLPAPQGQKVVFTLGSAWRRFSTTAYLTNYPSGSDFQVIIEANADVSVDAVQLEEGDLSEFRPAAAVEIGFRSDHPGRILYENENPGIELHVANQEGQPFGGIVAYEIYDLFNRKIASEEMPVSVAANSTQVLPFTSPPGVRGMFRALAWVKGFNGTSEEITWAVVPRPRVLGVDEASLIGVHPNLMPFQLAMHERLGYKWSRALSPTSIFRWSKVELVEGQIKWYDDQIARVAPYGQMLLGTIGTNYEWPSWADSGGLPDLVKWESFVDRLVTHYRDRVRYWEIWNEPIYVFTPEFYAELLRTAARAIRRADPSAKIVGMGGVYRKDWVVQVMNLLGPDWRQHLDYVSTHLYPPSTDPSGGETEARAMGFRTDVIDRYGVEVWNTETGVWDEGFYKGRNSNFSPTGDPIWPHFDSERYVRGSFYEPERLIENFVHCVGNGLTKYFYYDSRIYNNPTYMKSHPTMLEYDDSIRSKGIVYAIMAHFLDGSQGLGNISPSIVAYAYLFSRGGQPTMVLHAKDKQNHTLTLSGTGWRVYDMVGNLQATTAGTIPFGRVPLYVRADSLSVDAMRAAFQSATVAARGDELPPNLSIDEFPVGLQERGRSFRIRWVGIDDVSISSASNPQAVQYSYRLEGLESSWSPWAPSTHISYAGLADGRYNFQVRARDGAGNESAVASREFVVGDADLLRPTAPVLLRVAP